MATEAKIKPALTAEQWEAELNPDARGPVSYDELVKWSEYEHQIAAVALHGQPFGFTREDVEALREVACCPTHTEACESIADRIEALLPPEE